MSRLCTGAVGQWNDCASRGFHPQTAECPPGKTLAEMEEVLATFIRSMFWKNDEYFLVTVASLFCAFHRIETGVMIHAVGGTGIGSIKVARVDS